jgi:hypothetical protein
MASNEKRESRINRERGRWLHDVERRKRRNYLKRATTQTAPNYRESEHFGYRSASLGLMSSCYQQSLPHDSVVAGQMAAPRVFSLHHNPTETILFIQRIARYAKQSRKRLRLFIDLGRVEEMDLAADSLLAIILKEIKHEWFNTGQASIRGRFPRSAELRREMEEVGAVRVLQTDPGRDNVELSFRQDVKVYRHRETGIEIERTYDAPATIEKVTQQFADHVNGCLGTINRELNETGRGNLCNYIGELLSNAQEHAGITDWTIIGYLDAQNKVFKVAVINFGRSIEQTFLPVDRASYTWEQVGKYLERHESNAAKKIGATRGTLITLGALQGKVSSKNITAESTRGHGTVAMIEFFQRIHAQCVGEGSLQAEMALISGDCYISFDGRYSMKFDQRTQRDVIAFNSTNDLMRLPDGRVVKSMPGVTFPGTVITIGFPLTDKLQIREVDRGQATTN